ncbi:hypothetical protein [Paraburkholderia youngii]|uniref:hypothetical protein n=1 Tax=Paraburkholderia youngii TaxID=2782701 RepID=UPI001594FFA3|nr:hypothetical protein [Paraburkholderia youngii]
MGQAPASALLVKVRRRVSVYKPLRAAITSSVYVFDSPKCCDRLVIVGDIPFMYALMAEADPSISAYFFLPGEDSGTGGRSPQMKVCYLNGQSRTWRFANDEKLSGQDKSRGKGKGAATSPDASQPTIDGLTVTRGIVALRRQVRRVDNILMLCSMFNRARGCNVWNEARHLDELLIANGEATVAELLRLDGIDPACMLGVIALRVLNGSVSTDIDKRLFGRTSVIRRDETALPTPLTPLAAVLASVSAEQAAMLDEEEETSAPGEPPPNRGRPRTLVPPEHMDYRKWVQVDAKALQLVRGETVASPFRKRCKAVQMYLDQNSTLSDIEKSSGITQAMVPHWVKRCLLPDGAGGIVGFPALVPGGARKGYNRTEPHEGTQGSGSAGYAGKFGQLLSEHPEIAERIENLLFGEDPACVPETRMPYTAIHEIVRRDLRDAGLTDDDYPLNTDDAGFQSLYRFCKELEQSNPARSRTAREGKDAGRRRDGRGPRPRIRARRPMSIAQLDFHYTDAIGIVVLVDRDGVEHELPVKRFYIGLLIDEDTGSILGFHYVLQVQPSTDSVLDVVESSLYPRAFAEDDPHLRFTPDGKFLMNSFIPELGRHGFCMLRMDRGWSNIAKDVTNNIMSELGCALHFGPSRSWWVRPLIERIFGILTSRGLQRIPSTLGSGPQDVRKDRPAEEAIRYRVMVSDILAVIAGEINRFNTEGRAGGHEASPLEVMQAALSHAESPYMPQPLARDKRHDWALFSHLERIRISRDRSGARPCARVSAIDCRYRNPYLAESDWLVGKYLLVYINRRDVRQAIGVLADTGTYIGELTAEGRFEEGRLTWTEAVAFKRRRHIRARHGHRVSGATTLREELAQAARTKQPKAKPTPGSKSKSRSNPKPKAAKTSEAALAAAKRQLDHEDDPPPAQSQAAWQNAGDTRATFGIPLKVVSGKGRK